MLKSGRLLIATLSLVILASVSGALYLHCRNPLRVGVWVSAIEPSRVWGLRKIKGVIIRGPENYKDIGPVYWVRTGPPFIVGDDEDWYFPRALEPLSRDESSKCYMEAKFKLPGED